MGLVWVDHPDGSQIPFDPDRCLERYRLSDDDSGTRWLYHMPAVPAGDFWVYREILREVTGRVGRHPVFMEHNGTIRVVTREEAREMIRVAGLGLPSSLIDGPPDPTPGAPHAGGALQGRGREEADVKVPTPRNDARDRYIHEQRSRNHPTAWRDIVDAVNRRPGWAHFNPEDPEGRVDAASKALDRYCRRHPELPIPKREHGRNRRK